jgi:hypothetical protein
MAFHNNGEINFPLPEVGRGERLILLDVLCNGADESVTHPTPGGFVVSNGFPRNTKRVGVVEIDGIVDPIPGVASRTSSLQILEGLYLDQNEDSRTIQWQENSQPLEIILPSTITDADLFHCLGGNTIRVTTSVPHQFLEIDISILGPIPVALTGITTGGWGELVAVVDDTTLEITVPNTYIAGTDYVQEPNNCLTVYWPPAQLQAVLCTMINVRMTLASAYGLQYTMAAVPYMFLTVSPTVSTPVVDGSISIRFYSEQASGYLSIINQLGFLGANISLPSSSRHPSGSNLGASVTIPSRMPLEIGLRALVGAVPATQADLADMLSDRLNGSGFDGTLQYVVTGGSSGSITFLPNTRYTLESMARQLTIPLILFCNVTTDGKLSLVADPGVQVRLTFSDPATARRLGFADYPFLVESTRPVKSNLASVPFASSSNNLPLDLLYSATLQNGRLAISAFADNSDPVLAQSYSADATTFQIAATATSNPVPDLQVLWMQNTLTPGETAFAIVSSVMGNGTSVTKDITVDVHSAYLVLPCTANRVQVAVPSIPTFSLYNGARLGFAGASNMPPAFTNTSISSSAASGMSSIGRGGPFRQSFVTQLTFESTSLDPIVAFLPPLGTGTARPRLLVRITADSSPGVGGVLTTEGRVFTSVVTVLDGLRWGDGDGFSAIANEKAWNQSGGGNNTVRFNIDIEDSTGDPWDNDGNIFYLRLRFTAVQSQEDIIAPVLNQMN